MAHSLSAGEDQDTKQTFVWRWWYIAFLLVKTKTQKNICLEVVAQILSTGEDKDTKQPFVWRWWHIAFLLVKIKTPNKHLFGGGHTEQQLNKQPNKHTIKQIYPIERKCHGPGSLNTDGGNSKS